MGNFGVPFYRDGLPEMLASGWQGCWIVESAGLASRHASVTIGRSQHAKSLAPPKIANEFGFVAQLDRASVFGTEGWGFESLRAY